MNGLNPLTYAHCTQKAAGPVGGNLSSSSAVGKIFEGKILELYHELSFKYFVKSLQIPM